MAVLPHAILFDMDGTLTVPMFDFPRIRAEIGLAEGQPILEAMANMPPAQHQRAQEILFRYEDEAAAAATLNNGCQELLHWIQAQGIRTALITRNRRRSVDTFLARFRLPLGVLITREDGQFKPDPAPLLMACQQLQVPPQSAWMVGDGQYDIEAGLAAGTRTVWISHGKPRTFAAQPWQAVTSLPELGTLLRQGA